MTRLSRSFVRLDAFRQQHQLQCLFHADDAWREVGLAAVRRQANGLVGAGEVGIVGCDSEVANRWPDSGRIRRRRRAIGDGNDIRALQQLDASVYRADQFREVLLRSLPVPRCLGKKLLMSPPAMKVFTGTLHDDDESPVLRDTLDRRDARRVIAISSAFSAFGQLSVKMATPASAGCGAIRIGESGELKESGEGVVT